MNKLFFVFLLFFICPAFGYVNENTINQCGIIGNDFSAVFEINSYTCQSGFFLPANTLGCRMCPTNQICSGGNFVFNKHVSQGIIHKALTNDALNACADNFPALMIADFTPNIHTCTPGYYLPANVDSCTKCPADNYCPGGTYTFNETEVQGITPCPTAHPYAPAGMWTATQCGRILHIGNEIIYLHQSPANPTEHRLYVRVNDAVYSVNLTQKQDGSDDIKMSAGANRSLHIMFNGIEYLAHDDSTENQ